MCVLAKGKTGRAWHLGHVCFSMCVASQHAHNSLARLHA